MMTAADSFTNSNFERGDISAVFKFVSSDTSEVRVLKTLTVFLPAPGIFAH